MRLQILFAASGLLLIVIGRPLALRRIGPNRWYGLRVPATFADKKVWYAANAAMGRDAIVTAAGSLVVSARSWHLANRLLLSTAGLPSV